MDRLRDKIIEHTIINFEGVKYTNIAGDKGGPTKFGITLATLSAYRGSQCSAKDVENMEMSEAIQVYTKNYWNFYNIDWYPEKIRHLVFDMYVQHRPSAVGKIIQRGVNYSGGRLTVDGVVGHKTIKEIQRYSEKLLISNITKARIDYYKSLVAKDPTQKKFLNGWLNRANWFLSKSIDI